MKIYNLIIMNDCWEPKVTPYLGSFSSKEKAITGFKRFLKEATKDKETLVKIYQNMEEDYAEDDYSLIGEAVQIIVTDVDELSLLPFDIFIISLIMNYEGIQRGNSQLRGVKRNGNDRRLIRTINR